MLTILAAWDWLKKHWKLGIAAAVAGIVGAQSIRISILKRRAVKQQAGADLALREVRSAETAKEAKRVEAGLVVAQKIIDGAKAEDRAGQDEAAKALEDRKKIASKYGSPCLIFALSLGFAQAGEDVTLGPAAPTAPAIAATAQPCPADADLRGLLAAVGRVRAHLTGLDDQAVGDLAAVVETYQRERIALCARLAAHQAQIAALEELAAGRLELVRLARAEAADWRQGYGIQSAAAVKAAGKGHLATCVAGAGPGIPMTGTGTEGAIMAGLFCGWDLLQ